MPENSVIYGLTKCVTPAFLSLATLSTASLGNLSSLFPFPKVLLFSYFSFLLNLFSICCFISNTTQVIFLFSFFWSSCCLINRWFCSSSNNLTSFSVLFSSLAEWKCAFFFSNRSSKSLSLFNLFLSSSSLFLFKMSNCLFTLISFNFCLSNSLRYESLLSSSKLTLCYFASCSSS